MFGNPARMDFQAERPKCIQPINMTGGKTELNPG